MSINYQTCYGENYSDKKRKLNDSDQKGIGEEISVLMEVPQMMVNVFNTGNIDELRSLINTFFTEDCVFQTLAMQNEVRGRNFVLEYFESMTHSIPDMILEFRKTQFIEEMGIIVARVIGSGTKQFTDTSEYMYNLPRYGPSNIMLPHLREKALNIENSGGHFRFVSRGTWLMTLDSDFIKVRKFVMFYRPKQILEAPTIL
jgi:hypothetical protein